MRSPFMPRVPHDATVELGAGKTGRAVNLSTGGIYVTADAPLDPGEQISLKVNLHDGGAPLDARAEVMRIEEGGMALRWIDLDDLGIKRIQRLVQKREPTGVGAQKRDVRIQLPSLPAPLRATARDLSERGLMLEAELPWLRLGSEVTTELSPERAVEGHVQWIGLDVTRAGAARLRIFVDLSSPAEGSTVAPGGVAPPREVLEAADDALPPPAGLGVEATAPRRRSWWPALAATAALGLAGAALALQLTRPTTLILPASGAESGPVARAPSLVTVPKVPSEEPAPADAAPVYFGPATRAEAEAATAANEPATANQPAAAMPEPAAPATAPEPAKAQKGKADAKAKAPKRRPTRPTRRAG